MKVSKKTVEELVQKAWTDQSKVKNKISQLPLAELGNLIFVLKTLESDRVVESLLEHAIAEQTKKQEASKERKTAKLERHHSAKKEKEKRTVSFA